MYKNQEPINIIKNILHKYIYSNGYKVFIFGSRAKGNYKENSDRDTGILGSQKLPLYERFDIKNKFAETPLSVDFVDFSRTDDVFRELSMKNIIYIN